MLTSEELGSYNLRIINELNGKFGTSYFVQSTLSNKTLIFKEITHPSQIEFLSNGGDQQLIKLNHPAIPKTERVIWSGSKKAYILREYLEGTDLKQTIANTKLYKAYTTKNFVNLYIKLLETLEYLHKQNIIHQDIKPSNLIIDSKNSSCYLIDLEQAKTKDYLQLFKTPFALLYSPPEMILNCKSLIDERADIYSVGISLYETITRKRAFENRDPELTINLQLTYPLTNDYNLDKSLFAIIKKATSKGLFPKPPSQLSKIEIENILLSGIKQRYSSAVEMRMALMNWTDEMQSKKNWKFW